MPFPTFVHQGRTHKLKLGIQEAEEDLLDDKGKKHLADEEPKELRSVC